MIWNPGTHQVIYQGRSVAPLIDGHSALSSAPYSHVFRVAHTPYKKTIRPLHPHRPAQLDIVSDLWVLRIMLFGSLLTFSQKIPQNIPKHLCWILIFLEYCKKALATLTPFGLIVNPTKGHLEPLHDLIYLKARFNTCIPNITLPQNKIRIIKKRAARDMSCSHLSAA